MWMNVLRTIIICEAVGLVALANWSWFGPDVTRHTVFAWVLFNVFVVQAACLLHLLYLWLRERATCNRG
jgi:hypothetical protein